MSYLIIAAFFAIILFIMPDNNVISWIAARREIASQERQIRKYQKEIMQMDKTYKNLCSDKDSLEKFARENFHFTETGDDVYLLP